MMDALRINARRDAERTGAKEDIGVRHRAKRVADDEESNVLIMSENLPGSRLGHVALNLGQ